MSNNNTPDVHLFTMGFESSYIATQDRQFSEKIERGGANPTLYTLSEIADALEVSLSVLVDF